MVLRAASRCRHGAFQCLSSWLSVLSILGLLYPVSPQGISVTIPVVIQEEEVSYSDKMFVRSPWFPFPEKSGLTGAEAAQTPGWDESGKRKRVFGSVVAALGFCRSHPIAYACQ